MVLPVVRPSLCPVFLLVVKLALLFPGFTYLLPLEAEPHLIQSITKAFDNMEAVNDDRGIGEHLLDDGVHGIREVHGNFPDCMALRCGNLHQLPYHILCLCATDSSDECTVLAVSVLVGKEGEQVIAVHALVNAKSLTHIPWKKYPVRGMPKLFPLAKAAQMVLVAPFKYSPIDLKVPLQRAGRYGVGIQIFFLRHQQIPLNSWCLRLLNYHD